jgi:hypothetical protein
MTAVSEPAKPRTRGNIRRMRDRVQVRVSAGEDPSIGERIILVDTVMIETPGNARSERAALKEAEKLRTKLPAAVGRRPLAGNAIGTIPADPSVGRAFTQPCSLTAIRQRRDGARSPERRTAPPEGFNVPSYAQSEAV